jgi:choline dehydrogenase
VLANPVQPHSEGEIVLTSDDPGASPDIRMNYYGDPYDMDVMISVLRKTLDIVDHWPGGGLGEWLAPPALAEKHGYKTGDVPSDALLEDMARYYSFTVYHLTSTCRMGDVVDERLRVNGVAGLRVADASIMPNVTSGNTNAPSIMIGEKAAEMLAADHGVALTEVVGQRA